jgi:queuine tRNA-ribosyltransferase
LGSMILTLNNINFYQELMSEIRKNIKRGTFTKFYRKYANKL